MKLDRCSGCDGFLPMLAARCPHCDRVHSKLATAAVAVVGGAISFTLMACYGAPPCADSSNICSRTTPSTDTSAMPTSSMVPSVPPMPGALDAGAPKK